MNKAPLPQNQKPAASKPAAKPPAPVSHPPATVQTRAATAPGDYISTIQGVAFQQRIAEVLPDFIDKRRFMSAAIAAAKAFALKPNIVPASVLVSVYEAASIGLSLDAQLQHAHLVPFNSKSGKALIQLIPGYRGLIHLAKKSGELKDIRAYVVYEKDVFQVWNDDTGTHYRHEPIFSGDRGKRVAAYCLYWLTDDPTPRFHLVSGEKVLAVKKSAMSRGGAVWKEWEEDMWLKTAIRQTLKTMELSPAVSTAINREEAMEAGKMSSVVPEGISDMIDTAEYEEVTKETESENQPPVSSKPETEAPRAKSETKEAASTTQTAPAANIPAAAPIPSDTEEELPYSADPAPTTAPAPAKPNEDEAFMDQLRKHALANGYTVEKYLGTCWEVFDMKNIPADVKAGILKEIEATKK